MGERSDGTRAAEPIGLEHLLAPRTAEEFFRLDFQRRPFVVQGRDPSVYAGLLSLEQVEQALETYDPRDGKCRLLGDDASTRRTVEKGTDIDEVLVAYGRGASINLGGLDRRCHRVAELRRRLREDFAANHIALSDYGDSVVFITPANSQAIKPHVDPDDLFVLQLEGRKHWKVFARDPHWQSGLAEDLPAATLDVELRPGDLLYVPQNWIHVASAGEEFSFALTVGFRPVSWGDVVTSLATSHLFGVDPIFEALPAWAVAGARLTPRGRACLTELLRGVLGSGGFQRALERVEIRRGPSVRTSSIAAVNRTRRLSAETLCTLSGAAKVERRDDAVEIAIDARRVKAPLSVEPALAWIAAQSGEFKVGAIGGALTDHAKLVLARRLVLEGILQLRSGVA